MHDWRAYDRQVEWNRARALDTMERHAAAYGRKQSEEWLGIFDRGLDAILQACGGGDDAARIVDALRQRARELLA